MPAAQPSPFLPLILASATLSTVCHVMILPLEGPEHLRICALPYSAADAIEVGEDNRRPLTSPPQFLMISQCFMFPDQDPDAKKDLFSQEVLLYIKKRFRLSRRFR